LCEAQFSSHVEARYHETRKSHNKNAAIIHIYIPKCRDRSIHHQRSMNIKSMYLYTATSTESSNVLAREDGSVQAVNTTVVEDWDTIHCILDHSPARRRRPVRVRRSYQSSKRFKIRSNIGASKPLRIARTLSTITASIPSLVCSYPHN